MPAVLQWLTYLDPLRYFLSSSAAPSSRASAWTCCGRISLAMAAIGSVLIGFSVLRLEKSVD